MQAKTIFAEALAPLARKFREQQSTVRLISEAVLEIRGEKAFEGAVREAVAWMKNRSPSIPKSAFEGVPFLVAGGGDHPAQAVCVERNGAKLWAAVLDYPDNTVPKRTWVTEVSIGQRGATIAFGVRLLNVTRGEDAPFESSRPGLIRQLLLDQFVVADGRRLRDSPDFIESEEEVDNLIELIGSAARRLPVVVISRTSTGVEAINPLRLTPLVSGLAHVFVLDEASSWGLTRKFGKSLSVFLGAARIYNPGFNASSSDPFDHPLWLVRDITDKEAAEFRFKQITTRIFAQSVRKISAANTFPRFSEVRQVSAAEEREEAKNRGGTDAELLTLYEQDNKALRLEIERQKSEFQESSKLNTETLEIAERERDEARSDVFALRSRIQMLEEAIKVRGVTLSVEPLKDYADIGEWSKTYLAGHIWIAPKAIRETEKNGSFEDIKKFTETLLLLRDHFVPMRRDPGEDKRRLYLEKLQQLGLDDQPCFSQPDDIFNFPQYAALYDSKKFWCEDHIKFGGGYDARRMFRIYYHWHKDEGILLIGHMPTHLDNMRTN